MVFGDGGEGRLGVRDLDEVVGSRGRRGGHCLSGNRDDGVFRVWRRWHEICGGVGG